ncbi:MAG: hypothetical protein IJZ80_10915 [Clostridia bacterium]|nr:hypothetical protein [Clostridia bacterium]
MALYITILVINEVSIRDCSSTEYTAYVALEDIMTHRQSQSGSELIMEQ